MKNEGPNLNPITSALKSIVNCEILGLKERFQGTCFGHAFSKARQYITTHENVCEGFKYVSIKFFFKLTKMQHLAKKILARAYMNGVIMLMLIMVFIPRN
jgi:hypothetical protein